MGSEGISQLLMTNSIFMVKFSKRPAARAEKGIFSHERPGVSPGRIRGAGAYRIEPPNQEEKKRAPEGARSNKAHAGLSLRHM
jgi:hypothetical protein